MTYPIEKLMDKFDVAPKDIQNAFLSEDVARKIADIIDEHRLTYAQATLLGDQIVFVMLGLAHPNQFVGNLQQALKISPKDAKGMADDVNKLIFQPVGESLKKLHGITGELVMANPVANPAANSIVTSNIVNNTQAKQAMGQVMRLETDPDHLLAEIPTPIEIGDGSPEQIAKQPIPTPMTASAPMPKSIPIPTPKPEPKQDDFFLRTTRNPVIMRAESDTASAPTSAVSTPTQTAPTPPPTIPKPPTPTTPNYSASPISSVPPIPPMPPTNNGIHTLEQDFEQATQGKTASTTASGGTMGINASIIGQKLSQATGLPKEKSLNTAQTAPSAPQFGADGKRLDPYREQI